MTGMLMQPVPTWSASSERANRQHGKSLLVRVLYFWQEDGSFMQSWQRRHFIEELREKGVEFHVFNPRDYATIEHANEAFVSLAAYGQSRFDLLMTCMGSDSFLVETARRIHGMDIPSLLICFDNLHSPFMHRSICRYFDLVWLTSSETEWLFKKWGASTHFAPYAANPRSPISRTLQERLAVSFIGTLYGARQQRMNALGRAGVQCDVYTGGSSSSEPSSIRVSHLREALELLQFDVGRSVLWGFVLKALRGNPANPCTSIQYRGNPTFDELAQIYASSALSLSVTELRNTFLLKNPVHKIHLRSFEIPMALGVQLAPYTPELAGYFEADKEILFFSSEEELVSKAKYFVHGDRQHYRDRIRFAARRRAEAEHTWSRRFHEVFAKLKLGPIAVETR